MTATTAWLTLMVFSQYSQSGLPPSFSCFINARLCDCHLTVISPLRGAVT